MKSFLGLCLFAIAIYVAFGLLLYLGQRSMMYFPTPRLDHGFREDVINSGNIELRIVVANPGRDRAIVYFGGNAEAVAMNAPEFANMFPEFTIYLVNYRGYGGSGGLPGEAGILADARVVMEQVRASHSSVSVIGRSLGSGVACMLAAEYPLDKLVLVSPYDSILNLAQVRFPIYPARLILKDHYDSLKYAAAIQLPTLVLAAEYDRVIPRGHTDNLVRHLPSDRVNFQSLGGTDHNSIGAHPDYLRFIREHLGSG